MMTARCATCFYWKLDNPNKEDGTCHRDPPRAVPIGNGYSTPWPQTAADDWCGEYEEGPFGGGAELALDSGQ